MEDKWEPRFVTADEAMLVNRLRPDGGYSPIEPGWYAWHRIHGYRQHWSGMPFQGRSSADDECERRNAAWDKAQELIRESIN